MDLYVRRFHEIAFDRCNAVDEETLIDIYLHGMTNEYRVYLENLTFPSLSKLMEATRRTYRSFGRTPRSSLVNRSGPVPRQFPRRRAVVAAVEDNQETRPPRLKRTSSRQGYKSDSRLNRKQNSVLRHSLVASRKLQHFSSNRLKMLLLSC